MLLSPVIGLVLMGFSALVARAVNMPRTDGRIIERSRSTATGARPTARGAEERRCAGRSTISPEQLGRFVAGGEGRNRETEVRNHLMAAGLYGMTPRRFIGYQTLAAITFPASWIWFSGTMGFSKIIVVIGFIVSIYLGWRRRSSSSTVEVDIGSRRSTTSSRSSSTFSSSR